MSPRVQTVNGCHPRHGGPLPGQRLPGRKACRTVSTNSPPPDHAHVLAALSVSLALTSVVIVRHARAASRPPASRASRGALGSAMGV